MFALLRNFICLLLFLCLAAVFAADAIGQDTEPPKVPKPRESMPKPGPEAPVFFYEDGVTSERSMLVDPNVVVKVCVSEGTLKINGWNRDEVRVFVKNGRKFGMKALEKSAETGKVNWLRVAHLASGPPRTASDCLAGERIEIDAPLGSSFDVSGRDVRTTVDSIRKVNINLLAGAITLRNVKGGINAQTDRGDLMVENSAGTIELGGTTGNIVIVEVSPGQIGDMLKARTQSGQIILQRVDHRQIQANSISGSLLFDGKFLSGGIYNFRTSNGSIRLAIPASSSCTFKATYGFGTFKSEIPLKILTENDTPRARTVVASLGEGAAAVSLTTSSGSIDIRKTEGKP